MFVPTWEDLQACCRLLAIDVHCPSNDSCAGQRCIHAFQIPVKGIQVADTVVCCIRRLQPRVPFKSLPRPWVSQLHTPSNRLALHQQLTHP